MAGGTSGVHPLYVDMIPPPHDGDLPTFRMTRIPLIAQCHTSNLAAHCGASGSMVKCHLHSICQHPRLYRAFPGAEVVFDVTNDGVPVSFADRYRPTSANARHERSQYLALRTS